MLQDPGALEEGEKSRSAHAHDGRLRRQNCVRQSRGVLAWRLISAARRLQRRNGKNADAAAVPRANAFPWRGWIAEGAKENKS